jgi:hypothetical protein
MKKGLFFAVSVALLVALMFLTASIWSATQKVRDSVGPERMKSLSLQTLLSSVSQEELHAISGILGREAIYGLNWHVRHSGVYSGDVGKDFGDMFVLGRCRPIDLDGDGEADLTSQEFESLSSPCFGLGAEGECAGFDLNGDGIVDSKDSGCLIAPEVSAASLRGFSEKLAGLAGERGFELTLSAEGFAVEQKTPWTVQVSFTADLRIVDLEGRSGINRRFPVAAEIPITGLDDPLSGVESGRAGFAKPGLRRPILPYPGPEYVREIEIPDSARGKGWVYGELAMPRGASAETSGKILYLDGDADSFAWLADGYAGVVVKKPAIVTASQERYVNSTPGCTVICEYTLYEEVSNCLDCMRWSSAECGPGSQVLGGGNCPTLTPPAILELTGKNLVSVPFLSGAGELDAESVLFHSSAEDSASSFDRGKNGSSSSAWDIRGLRELALCGGFVNNPDSPDFLQRLSGKTTSASDNGIESLLIPGLLNGIPGGAALRTPVSMADRSYYSGQSGFALMGMPGCRNAAECELNWPGVFALGEEHLEFYGAAALARWEGKEC